MLKILIVNTIGLDFEGITQSILSYLDATDRSDMMIDFVLVSNNFHPEMLKIIKEMGCGIYVLPSRMKSTLRYFLAIRNLISKKQYDIVHAHGNSATLAIEMWAAMLAGCKVRIAHSRNTVTSYPKLDKFLRPLFNVAYTQAFACGIEAGKWLFRDNKFLVIPNGKNISKFAYDSNQRTEIRRRLNLANKVVIGHVGNFNRQKNHDFLIKIFRDLASQDQRYVLYLMGEGSQRPQIERMIEAYGLKDQVFFTGSISNIAEMLQAMDIMVLPSRFEGLPNVVVEWQIACLPCVISDVITKECQLTDLVHTMPLQEGPTAWAEKIRSIEVLDRESMKAGVLETIRTAGFDIEENAKQLKKIYYELLPLRR